MIINIIFFLETKQIITSHHHHHLHQHQNSPENELILEDVTEGNTGVSSLSVIHNTLVKCFFYFLYIDALLMVGSIVLGQNSEERTKLQPPLVCGNAAVPVCLALELCHGLEPARVARWKPVNDLNT